MLANEFDGAVLCGGASRRMGRDKATIVVDGLPMYRRVLGALGEAGASALTVVGGTLVVSDAEAWVADRWPGHGPLGGVITALSTPGPSAAIAVVSCDLVTPDPAAIAAVVAGRSAVDADVAVAVAGGRDQWTFAVWHRRLAGPLGWEFEDGERAIRHAVTRAHIERVEVPESAVRDADTPDDLP